MSKLETLKTAIKAQFSYIESCEFANKEVTVEVPADKLTEFCLALRKDKKYKFNMLIDVCGVDYLQYGITEWATDETTTSGFSRGVERGTDKEKIINWQKPRFAVAYHLLSTKLNQRIRVRSFPVGEPPVIDSVVDIWSAASWFEREAFDMYGILFKGHPDLRRILTDYGFVGYPFRKDFPLSGHVEMRYDAKQQRVVYEPVEITPRVLVPKVIRQDNRYSEELFAAAVEARHAGDS